MHKHNLGWKPQFQPGIVAKVGQTQVLNVHLSAKQQNGLG